MPDSKLHIVTPQRAPSSTTATPRVWIDIAAFNAAMDVVTPGPYKQLTPLERVIFYRIAARADGQGVVAVPSMRGLARDLNVPRTTLDGVLARGRYIRLLSVEDPKERPGSRPPCGEKSGHPRIMITFLCPSAFRVLSP
ncbi:hypothetical protein AMYX_16800 [Anaeromyxobacter diazotrophicus]|uniref:Uncharacterized protein n=1 Tax=Anaeromyxobacter diazotrophicus TaxID=2590199 RepID=A0A7I9VLF6_9BACT|nr:hypothetical protein AMYX_16800 [Anaeromyxobacter diazotrophicus]